jgi:lipopolysaccharide biosynthesis glycosyltransferase
MQKRVVADFSEPIFSELRSLSEPAPDLPVVIACGSSNEWAFPLTVSLHSALSRLDPKRSVHVYVMDGGISARNKARIHRSLSGAHPLATVEIITPDPAVLAGVPTTRRYPLAVYFRLLMPFVLPASVERVLYLDADVVVTEDVSPLFDMDLEDKPLWAVRDPTDGTDEGMPRVRRAFPWIKGRSEHSYFNGGVMLINLPEWRCRRVSERAIELIRTHGTCLRYLEQDPMNLLLDGDWGRLDDKWNNMLYEGRLLYPQTSGPNGGDGILHFIGGDKPWQWGTCSEREEVYEAAMRATGWHCPPFPHLKLEGYRVLTAAAARRPRLKTLLRQVRRAVGPAASRKRSGR